MANFSVLECGVRRLSSLVFGDRLLTLFSHPMRMSHVEGV
jgi:hypothetical protein